MTTQTITAGGYPWPTSSTVELKPLNEVPEVAHYLRCGRTHVFHLIKAGHLASVKVGRKRLIPETAVLAYIGALTNAAG